jgi:hypothetical protein
VFLPFLKNFLKKGRLNHQKNLILRQGNIIVLADDKTGSSAKPFSVETMIEFSFFILDHYPKII